MTEATRQLSHPPLSRIARYKHHFLPLEKDPDKLFARFAKTSVCQRVIKARKAGVIIEEVGDEKSLKVCHAILVNLRHRLCLPAIPYAFFQAMRRHLGPEHLKVFIAMQGGEAGSLSLGIDIQGPLDVRVLSKHFGRRARS